MKDVAIEVLLFLGVGVAWLSTIGVFAMRDSYQRLHYPAPAATLSSFTIAAAIFLEDGWTPAAFKAILVAVMIGASSTILTHAAARALRIRQFGHWVSQPKEKVPVETSDSKREGEAA